MLFDISIPVAPGTPEWPGDTPFSCGWSSRLTAGATVNLSTITTSPHVGTHADAPLHVRDGAVGIEALPLELFAGPAFVLGIEGDVRDVEMDELTARLPTRGPGAAGVPERLLLRGGAGVEDGTFPDDWSALSADCAGELAHRGLRLLGTDAPSVDRRHSHSLATHHALFDGGACNLENLALSGVPDGWYELVAYPVRLVGLDAAPVRAVLKPLGTR